MTVPLRAAVVGVGEHMSDERPGPDEGDQLAAAIAADQNRSAEEKQRMLQMLRSMRAVAEDPRP